MRLRVIGVVVPAAIVAALSLTPATRAATTTVGPLVLTGKRTIKTEGADIRSFSWTQSHGSKTFVFSRPVDAASPALFQANATGEHFAQAALTWGNGVQLHSLCLQDVVVASVSLSTGGGDPTPFETVSLNYLREGIDQTGTAACSKLGPAPPATVTVGVKRGTFSARVACLSRRCDGTLSLRLPAKACARRAGIMPPDKACAGRAFRLGRVALGDGSVRVLRLSVPKGRLRRALARLTAGGTRGIIAVLRRGTGRPITLTTIPGAAKPKLPEGLPAVQSTPVSSPPGAVATSLVITTCGPIASFPRQFAGQVTPAVAGLSITMTYTPPAPGAPIQQTVTTNAAGQFSDAVAATTPGPWSATASFAGNAAYGASTSPSCGFPGG